MKLHRFRHPLCLLTGHRLGIIRQDDYYNIRCITCGHAYRKKVDK